METKELTAFMGDALEFALFKLRVAEMYFRMGCKPTELGHKALDLFIIQTRELLSVAKRASYSGQMSAESRIDAVLNLPMLRNYYPGKYNSVGYEHLVDQILGILTQDEAVEEGAMK